MTNTDRRHLARVRNAFLGATALAGLASLATPASAVVINDNFTPNDPTVVDDGGVANKNVITGVGQMVIDLKNGFIGLCTVSLINPRTVIFASHCVNENPAGNGFEPGTGYGSANGGLPIGFFFNTNNNTPGNSAIGHWLNGVGGGPKDLTRVADNAYNSNFVVYNTNCCTIGLGNNFLQSDVAMAALDTPAVGVPTWTLLFSPLSAPTHSTIVGYGDNGIGTTGQGSIDFKRRIAENVVSVLGSLDDQDKFLFGAPDGLPANLYMMDFNDPKFNTAQANAFDFNIFHDSAYTHEGITAPGDSGGPLIIDHQFSAPTIAAVLSGGDRFFNAQPGSSYGTTSFYQPLYLYWDWIVANNPYKYVTSTAGNHNWTDANAFVMDLDPAYLTINGSGQTVNGLPTTAAQGQANVPPGFGEVCYFDDCINIKTGVETNPTPPPGPNPANGVANGAAIISANSLNGGQQQGSRPFGGGLGIEGFRSLVQSFVAANGGCAAGPALVAVSDLANGSAVASEASNCSPSQGGGGGINPNASPQSDWTNPEGTAHVGDAVNGEDVQGAPGASPGQVINNTAANTATGAPARYYDVTIAAAGTITLPSGSITVDKLTVNGASAGLTIAAGATLTTNISSNSFAGTTEVDGTLNSAGGVNMFGGILSGTGTVNGPTGFLLGAVAPGTNGTIGTLTINGTVSLGLGSTSVFDVNATTSDLLHIIGTITVNGTAAVAFLPGTYTLGKGYTLLTADGGVTGTYAASTFSSTPAGIIPVLGYDANDVLLTLTQAPFIWSATPASGDWNLGSTGYTSPPVNPSNWQYNLVPTITDVAHFGATTNANVTIGAPSAAKQLVFDAGAPAYSFAITGTAGGPASLTIDQGINNIAGNAVGITASGQSVVNAGVVLFKTSGTAANTTLTANNFGGVFFTGNANAGTGAKLVVNSGGTVDFSGTTGTAGDKKISSGAISGTGGTINIGADAYTVDDTNGPASSLYSGAIMGAGSFTKAGANTLILAADQAYTGGTTISAGALQFGNGGTSGGASGNLVNNGTVIYNRSDAIGFSTVISGTGNLVQAGTGNLILTATSTYTGTTTVQGGTLTVNGSIAQSAVTVNSGGTLGGNGTVGATTVQSGGTLSPGTNGTVATLAVSGNLNLMVGSHTIIDVTNTSSDLITVSGTTALGAGGVAPGITFNLPASVQFGESHLFLQSTGAVSGTLPAVADPYAGALFPTIVTVTTPGGVTQEVLTIQATPFSSFLGASTTPDQLTIAGALDALRPSSYANLKPLYDALDGLNSSQLGQALENLAPDALRTAPLMGDMEATAFDTMLWQHLGDIGGGANPQTAGLTIDSDGLKSALTNTTPSSFQSMQLLSLGQGIATNPGGGNQAVATTGTAAAASPRAAEGMWLPGGASGFLSGSALQGSVAVGGGGGRADVRGMVIAGGLDMPVGNGFTVGGALAYSDASAVLRAAPSSLQSDSIQGAVYVRYDFADTWMAEAFGAYGHQTMTTRRLVVVGGSTFALTGHTGGDTPSLGAYVGRAFHIDTLNGAPITLTPNLSLTYLNSEVDPFVETGGAPAMTFSGFSESSFASRLGIDAKMGFDLGSIKLLPNLHLAWVDNFEGNNGSIQAAFAGAPSSIMTFAMIARDRSYGEMGVGLDADLGEFLGTDAVLTGRYDANTRNDVQYGAWTGRLTIHF